MYSTTVYGEKIMKVKDMIEKLSKLDQEAYLFVYGYEGGYCDASLDVDEIKMVRDVHPEGYFGDHEVFTENSYDLRDIDLNTKVIDKGYIIGAE